MKSDSNPSPDDTGHFGAYGGRYVPETLVAALDELTKSYFELKYDKNFKHEFERYLRDFAGRPTPLYFAERLSGELGGRIYLKREDLCHTGAHKINNTIGQIILAKMMGKSRVIAETGAGQHGVATAATAAQFGMECVIYMGEEDIKRQSLNVFRMKLLGAEVRPVSSGSRTLKDAMNEAMRDWVATVNDTHYVIGSVAGPHPYPMMVADFQSITGVETKEQIENLEGRLPDEIVACVGGGSNSIGIWRPFIGSGVRLTGVEAGGLGLETGQHGASLEKGERGVLHGSMSYVLQNKYGQVDEAHSISAGLDYPGVGPEHSYLKDQGLAQYVSVTDVEAVEAFRLLSEKEGIIPALESSHAIAYLIGRSKGAGISDKEVIIANLSGRGDKDVQVVADFLGIEL